jgi:hypothetical protein
MTGFQHTMGRENVKHWVEFLAMENVGIMNWNCCIVAGAYFKVVLQEILCFVRWTIVWKKLYYVLTQITFWNERVLIPLLIKFGKFFHLYRLLGLCRQLPKDHSVLLLCIGYCYVGPDVQLWGFPGIQNMEAPVSNRNLKIWHFFSPLVLIFYIKNKNVE